MRFKENNLIAATYTKVLNENIGRAAKGVAYDIDNRDISTTWLQLPNNTYVEVSPWELVLNALENAGLDKEVAQIEAMMARSSVSEGEKVMSEEAGDDNIRVRIQVPVEIFWHQDDFMDERGWQQFKKSFDANAKMHLEDNIDFLQTEAKEKIADAIDRGDFEVIR